jgi:hypothetical protein
MIKITKFHLDENFNEQKMGKQGCLKSVQSSLKKVQNRSKVVHF